MKSVRIRSYSVPYFSADDVQCADVNLDVSYILTFFYCSYFTDSLTHFMPLILFIPPENSKKCLVFWCIHGGSKETSSTKRVNNFIYLIMVKDIWKLLFLKCNFERIIAWPDLKEIYSGIQRLRECNSVAIVNNLFCSITCLLSDYLYNYLIANCLLIQYIIRNTFWWKKLIRDSFLGFFRQNKTTARKNIITTVTWKYFFPLTKNCKAIYAGLIKK